MGRSISLQLRPTICFASRPRGSACRFVPIDLQPDHFHIFAEGDPKSHSTQSFSAIDSLDGAPVKLAHGFKIDYRFDPGWKYALLSPKPEHNKIEGKPAALCMWIKGDGSGNDLRARFGDSAGQTFQAYAGKLDFTDWQYIVFPLDGTHGMSWGGAHDGMVHYPIRLDTLLLIDSGARQATSGSVQIASPALIYSRNEVSR
jgi:hypothetical protein